VIWETPEAWLPIPGYAGYEASSLGRVRSLDRVITLKSRWGSLYQLPRKGRVLRPAGVGGRSGVYGHKMVMLGRGVHLMVHTAVALSFIGRRPFGTEVRHLDCDSSNNTPANLRWGTRTENNKDYTRAGKRKLTYAQAEEIRSALRAGATHTSLAVKFLVNTGTIAHIKSGKEYAP
jgi:hypothetical protein